MDDHKNLEDIIEKKLDSLFEKKIAPYMDKKAEELKENTGRYAKIELSKKAKVAKLLLAANGLASFKYCLDYFLNGMYIMLESFPKRPTEAYIDLMVGGLLGFWCYMSFHKSLTNQWL